MATFHYLKQPALSLSSRLVLPGWEEHCFHCNEFSQTSKFVLNKYPDSIVVSQLFLHNELSTASEDRILKKNPKNNTSVRTLFLKSKLNADVWQCLSACYTRAGL